MSKSLFDNSEPIPPTEEELRKTDKSPKENKSKGIPQLLPIDDGSNAPNKNQEVITDTFPYSDNRPQILTNNKPQILINTEKPVQMSGAFFIVDGKQIADIRLELNAEHPKYKEFLYKLKEFISEVEKYHVLKSSSGI